MIGYLHFVFFNLWAVPELFFVFQDLQIFPVPDGHLYVVFGKMSV